MRFPTHLLTISLLFLLLNACHFQEKKTVKPQQEVKVTRVATGNTLEISGLREQINLLTQVRLIGTDAAPRRQTPFGYRAQQRLQELIDDKPVMLEFDVQREDKYDRTLAYVWQNDVLLNEQLIKEGHALFVARSPNHKYDLRLERAQHFARIMGKGIWNPEKPMRFTPAEYRRRFR
ncbi:MAG: thermonuclease family protein [Cyanobacteria bacterium P01_A01_bin.45]